MMRMEDEAAKEHLAARDLVRGQESEVKAAISGKQKLAKVRVKCTSVPVCDCKHVDCALSSIYQGIN